MARVLAVLGGEVGRPRRRLDVGERAHPAFGLRDHLVRDHEHVRRPERRVEPRAGGGEQRGEVVARPDLRKAGEGVEPHAARVEPLEQRARPLRAASAAAERGLQRGEVAGRVDVELERRQPPDAHGRPGAGRQRGVAGERARPEGGHDRRRRVEQQRVRARAVAVGHDHHARLRRREELVDLGRVQRRAVAGNEEDPRGPARDGGPHAASGGRRTAPPRRDRARPRPPSTLAAMPGRLRRHHDHAVQPPHHAERIEHVRGHRLRELRAVVDGGAEALLRATEGLDGEDGDGSHRAGDLTRAARRRTPASPARHGGGRPRRPSRRRSRASAPRSRAGRRRGRR